MREILNGFFVVYLKRKEKEMNWSLTRQSLTSSNLVAPKGAVCSVFVDYSVV